MVKNVLRKGLVIGIIFLFVGASVIPSISSNMIDNPNSFPSANKANIQQGHSVPRVTDNSGNTTFHGLFIGTSSGNKDRFGGEADKVNDSLNGPGWDDKNSTTLENESATKKRIEEEIDRLKTLLKPGEELVIYITAHGNNNDSIDGVEDKDELGADKKDEKDGYDNYFKTSDGLVITDDELRDLIDGFQDSVTITVILDFCYSGTFKDGKFDLPTAGPEALNGKPYGDDHLSVIPASDGTTPAPNDPAGRTTFTDKILDGIKINESTGKPNADKNKDGILNSSELAKYASNKMNFVYWGDNDGDGLVDEDDIDYHIDRQTGEISFLFIDNDGDGLVDEDMAPTFPQFWHTDVYYVDDDASPGGNGSEERPFKTINEALDNCNDWCKIIVAEGEYHEKIQTELKYMELVGMSKGPFTPGEKTILNGDGAGSIIDIFGDFNIVTGFEFRNCGTGEEDAAISIRSNYNVISRNVIQDNGATGIYLHDSANYNYIINNVMQNNDGAGFFIWQNSQNNYIFRNSISDSGWFNVKDKDGGNLWDNGPLAGGNYWDDYTGTDSDGDGIGDTPYNIYGDYAITGTDNYPWVEPFRWNINPKDPIITGNTSGKIKEEQLYGFECKNGPFFEPGSEPFEEHVYCHVDWGDDTDEWIGPYSIGSRATASHSWDEDGTYYIRAQAVDCYGAESDWAEFQITITKSKYKIINTPFLQFLQNFLTGHPNLFPILRQLILVRL